MNNLKKIGLTALGTALISSTASVAGDMSVTGSAIMTFTGKDNTSNGNGWSMSDTMSFSGSGELDNGFTVSTTMILTETSALSSSNVALTMGGMGTVTIGNGLGSVGGGFDAVTPFAYEENHDGMATATALDSVGSFTDGNAVLYASPSFDLGGASASFTASFTPDAGDAATGEGGVQSNSANFGSGMAAGVKVSMAGLTAGIMGEEVENDQGDGSVGGARRTLCGVR